MPWSPGARQRERELALSSPVPPPLKLRRIQTKINAEQMIRGMMEQKQVEAGDIKVLSLERKQTRLELSM